MKVELKKDGYIVITGQNELEKYALKKWKEDNFGTAEKLENLKTSILVMDGVDGDDLPF